MPDRPLWEWNDKTKRYRNTKTGQFIGVDGMNALRPEYLRRQKDVLSGYVESLRKNRITLESFTDKVKGVLKDTYIDLYAMGAGGRNNMTQSDWGKIGAMLKQQYGQGKYLEGFMNQIAEGKLSEAQITARLQMYLNSANEALWKGITKGLPVDLPAYPGDGSTQCLTNCQCNWDVIEVEGGYDCYWRLGIAEHCPDCVERADKWNPYRIRITNE